jgi:hypothetical protein
MNSRNGKTHPQIEELALFSRGDLPATRRLLINAHVRTCPSCETEVEHFQAVAAAFKKEAAAQMLTSLEATADWARLEREMTGNIKVGIAAAECIDKGAGRRFHGRRVWMFAGALCLIFLLGWLINVPREDSDRILAALRRGVNRPQIAQSTILQTTPRGVSVQSQGARLTLLHPESVKATFSFTGYSSVGIRYIDDETGQVTITNVYGQ